MGIFAQAQLLNLEKEKCHFHGSNAALSKVTQATTEIRQTSAKTPYAEVKQVKGALPEGYFDNKEADLHAYGIKPVKPNVKYIPTFCCLCIFASTTAAFFSNQLGCMEVKTVEIYGLLWQIILST